MENLRTLEAAGMTYGIFYFPEAAYDRSGIELFEREVVPALAYGRAAVPRPSDVVEAFLHHLAVERGSAANTLRSYTVDLERYVAHLRAAGVDDLAAVREEHVTGFVVALRPRRTAGPRSPRRRRPGRSPPSAGCTASPPATAWCPPTSPAPSPRPRCPGGCRGR